MKKLFAACILSLSGLLSAGQSLAWNDKGHMAIAYIAYSRLSRAERGKVFALLKAHPDFANLSKRAGSPKDANYELLLFMYAACWPDFIRNVDKRFVDEQRYDLSRVRALEGFPDMGEHRGWHYKNQGFQDDGTSVALPDSGFDGDVQSKIFDFKMSIANMGLSEAHKGYFLSWLLHAVGDAHHPLHCASRVTPSNPQGDAFGTRFRVYPAGMMSETNRPISNLHEYWDNALGEETSLQSVRALAEAVDDARTSGLKASDLNEAEWVGESFEYAKGWAYGPLVGRSVIGHLTPSYYANTRFILLWRAKLAGQRLAGVLSQTLMYYTPPPPEPSPGQAAAPPKRAAKDGTQPPTGFFSAPVRATPGQSSLLQESALKTAGRKQSLRDELARLEPRADAEALKTILLAHIVAARQEVLAVSARVPDSAGDLGRAEKMLFGDIAARYDAHLESVRRSRAREYAAVRDRTLRLFDASHRALAGAAKGEPLTFDLEVVSAPEGADISYMRKGDAAYTSDGKKTSVTLRNIVRAIWYFRAELPGYKTQEKSFDPYKETSNVLTFRLEPLPAPPPSAREGTNKSRRTPHTRRPKRRAR